MANKPEDELNNVTPFDFSETPQWTESTSAPAAKTDDEKYVPENFTAETPSVSDVPSALSSIPAGPMWNAVNTALPNVDAEVAQAASNGQFVEVYAPGKRPEINEARKLGFTDSEIMQELIEGYQSNLLTMSPQDAAKEYGQTAETSELLQKMAEKADLERLQELAGLSQEEATAISRISDWFGLPIDMLAFNPQARKEALATYKQAEGAADSFATALKLRNADNDIAQINMWAGPRDLNPRMQALYDQRKKEAEQMKNKYPESAFSWSGVAYGIADQIGHFWGSLETVAPGANRIKAMLRAEPLSLQMMGPLAVATAIWGAGKYLGTHANTQPGSLITPSSAASTAATIAGMYLLSSFMHSFSVEFSSRMESDMAKAHADGRKVSRSEAYYPALVPGFINGLIEVGNAKQMMELIPGVGRLMSKAAAIGTNGVVKLARQKGVWGTLVGVMRSAFEKGLEEAGEEFPQNFVESLAGQITDNARAVLDAKGEITVGDLWDIVWNKVDYASALKEGATAFIDTLKKAGPALVAIDLVTGGGAIKVYNAARMNKDMIARNNALVDAGVEIESAPRGAGPTAADQSAMKGQQEKVQKARSRLVELQEVLNQQKEEFLKKRSAAQQKLDEATEARKAAERAFVEQTGVEDPDEKINRRAEDIQREEARQAEEQARQELEDVETVGEDLDKTQQVVDQGDKDLNSGASNSYTEAFGESPAEAGGDTDGFIPSTEEAQAESVYTEAEELTSNNVRDFMFIPKKIIDEQTAKLDAEDKTGNSSRRFLEDLGIDENTKVIERTGEVLVRKDNYLKAAQHFDGFRVDSTDDVRMGPYEMTHNEALKLARELTDPFENDETEFGKDGRAARDAWTQKFIDIGYAREAAEILANLFAHYAYRMANEYNKIGFNMTPSKYLEHLELVRRSDGEQGPLSAVWNPETQPGETLGSSELGTGALINQVARIILGAHANISTPAHEFFGHVALNDMWHLAHMDNAPESIKEDIATVEKVLGVSDIDYAFGVPLVTLDDVTRQRVRNAHEEFARRFEQYLRDGVAPRGLQKTFDRIRKWMIEIYKTIRDLGFEDQIPDELREVFDNMLMAPEHVYAPASNTQMQTQSQDSGGVNTFEQNATVNQALLTKDDYDENGRIRPEVIREITDELNAIRSEAEKNGTYLKAPNGNDSNLPAGVWEMVRTRRFKEWFGNSQVLDENGEPKIVYHGTVQAGFTQFDTEGAGKTEGAGAFFSDRKKIASTYAGGVENTLAPEYDESGNLVVDEYDEKLPLDSEHYIYPVFLKMEHPYIVDAQGKNWDNVGEITITDMDYSDAIYSKADGTPFMSEDDAWDYIEKELDDPEHQNYQVSLSAEMTTDEIARAVYKGYQGDDYVDGHSFPYDGVIFQNVADEGPAGSGYGWESTVYSVPTPEQIKSVDNRGTFDAGENIFYQNQVERRYKGKLHQDSIAWAKAVDKYLIGEMGDHDIVHVMDMPIALELAGAPVREIVADKTFFNHTISGKHSGEVKPALMKKLVRSLADPIMVFDSASHPGTSLVAMLELEDDQGATIVVPVRLQMDPTDPNSPAKITSFYGKGDPQTGTPNNKWFIKQVVDKNGNLTGRLKYVNRKKISRWSSVGGLQLPKALAPSRLPSSISTEADLVKYRKFNGNRFYQSAAPSNTLIATHGIDVSALEKAFANFDGQLPMPSLAIGRRGQQGATHYGEITLIGDKNMIDPQQNSLTDVYDTDMWSPTVPRPEYKLDRAKRKAMTEIVNTTFSKWSDYKTDAYEIRYRLGADDSTLDDIIRSAAQKIPFRAEYISQVLGKTPQIVRDEQGSIDDSASRLALLEQFRDLTGHDSSAYDKWVESQFRQLAGEALVKVGRKMLPYTAENVLEAMRKKGKLASEDSMFFGSGKVRAKGAKKLTSIEAMHKAEGQLATKQDFETWKEQVGDPAFKDAHSKLTAEMTRTEKAKGYEPNPFDMLDEAAHALANFISGKKSLESVTGIADLSEETKAAAQKYKDVLAQAKTEYFEAKPRRLVDVSEFRAAVVPASTPAELRQKLEERGIRLYEYPDGDQAARQQIAEHAAQEQNVFFQNAVPDKKWIETAPTGRPSKLTADQWRLVRTDEFKNWFGDWESASIIRQARNAWEDEKSKSKYMFAPSKKLEVALKQLLGHDVKSIVITDDSIRHAKKHHGVTQEETKRGQSVMTPEDIAVLPYVVNNFDSIEREPKHDKKSGRALTISKRINGLSVVATLEQGKKNVFVVTTWKKNMTGAADAQSASRLYVQDGPVTPLEIIKRDVAKIKSSFDNASKVVDENGEPLVVYHGTGTPDITEFKRTKATDKTGRLMALGEGKGKFYFTASRNGAQLAANGAVARGQGKSPTVMPVYLNLRKPILLSEYRARYQTLAGHGLNEGYSGDYTSSVRDKNIAQLDKAIKKEGFDGIADPDNGYYVAFEPNQIKSTQNIGTFDESANIYNQQARQNTQDQFSAFSGHSLEDLYDEDRLADERIAELEREPEDAEFSRVDEASWRSVTLDEAEAPEWLTRSSVAADTLKRDELRHKARSALTAYIRKHGGLSYENVLGVWGKSEAEELRKRDPGLFRKDSTLRFEEIPAEYAHETGEQVGDVNALYELLMSRPEGQMSGLHDVPFTDDTLAWMMYGMDDKAIVAYARQRRKAVQAELKTADETDAPALRDELDLIKDVIREMGGRQKRTVDPEQAAIKAEMKTRRAEIRDAEKRGRAEGRAAERARANERIAALKEKHKARVAEIREQYKERMGEQRRKDREKARLMREQKRQRDQMKKQIKRIIKHITTMGADKHVRWGVKQELERLLSQYTLKNVTAKRLAKAQALADYVKENPDVRTEDFTRSEQELLHMLETTRLSEMKLEDLLKLEAEVEEVHHRGRVEYEQWKQATDARRAGMFEELLKSIGRIPQRSSKVVRDVRDLRKEYKGVKGMLQKAGDWTYAATLGAQRLFDWIGNGGGQYDSAMTKYFMDMVNEARDEELRHVLERRANIEGLMKDLGISFYDLSKSRVVDGEAYSVDQLLSIYALLKNQKGHDALIYGNFRGLGNQAEAHAARCVQALTGSERALADAIIDDFDKSFDRLNERFIDVYNEAMDKEENYTPMHRLEYSSRQGLVDAESAETLEGKAARAGQRAMLENGFLHKRQEINQNGQRAVDLGLVDLWSDQVSAQEHTAAFAKVAGDLGSVLGRAGGADGRMTIGKAITLKYGTEAWKSVVGYTNLVIQNDRQIAHSALNSVTRAIGRHMSIAYLCGSLSTMLKQTLSLPRVLISAGFTQVFAEIGKFAIHPKEYIAEVKRLDPQMADRASNAFYKLIQIDPGKINELSYRYQQLLDLGMKHISLCDVVTASICWKAVYNACIKRGMSQQQAIREAQRAVALTQQTPQAKDQPALWQQSASGIAKLMMIFTNDSAQVWGMTMYDMAQRIKSGNVPRIAYNIAALTLGAMLLGMVTDGPPDDDDDENWLEWTGRVMTRQYISSVPVIGKELFAAYDSILNNKPTGNTSSALVAPFAKIMRGAKDMMSTDSSQYTKSGVTKFERGAWQLTEGFALLTGLFPVTAAKRTLTALRSDSLDDAFRAMLAMRRDVKRAGRGMF